MNPITPIPNDKQRAEEWIKQLQAVAEVEKKRVEIRTWIEPLRYLIQAGKADLPADTQSGANLDVAQQVLTQIENVNNR